MSNYPAVHVVGPEKFNLGTAQTPGSERLEAIAPQLGIETAMWGGLFEVAPSAHTGIHHHGEQQTIAYVLSGICEVRWGEKGEYAATANKRKALQSKAIPRKNLSFTNLSMLKRQLRARPVGHSVGVGISTLRSEG
jgi:uncharacterized RmlC-like cupin family protein